MSDIERLECFVSVIAPLQNDARILKPFVEEVMKVLRDGFTNYELVLVNDGSTDNTSKIVSSLLRDYECIRLINLSRSFGTDVAISSGLDSVIGDFVVVMIPESDPPQLIPELIATAQNGRDILIGIRRDRHDEPMWMKAGANLFYWLCRKLLKIPLIQNSTQFRVLSRQVVNAITQVGDKSRYLRLLGAYVGYDCGTFTYDFIYRYRHRRLKGILELLDTALQIIVVNSVRPLRFASYIGLLASVLNILYIVYIGLVYLLKERVAEGWMTLSFQNAIMFFFVSMVLTILAEYVGFIFDRLKGWPAYYVAGEQNSSVLIADRERRNIVQESKKVKI
ncbi:MAG: glycosyltransferase family 2 protein [Cyanobacteriota bacterium]|nr:glycosyltransferase family 2 protein [Cyanobacteriota bacterium]